MAIDYATGRTHEFFLNLYPSGSHTAQNRTVYYSNTKLTQKKENPVSDSKMKCSQRLCQRNKNLKQSGYCNVCDDLIEDLKKKHEASEKKRQFRRVELDLNLLRDTHTKLANGNRVDHNVVNILLLGGITNILSQSELFDITVDKTKELDTENLTNKVRLEVLENWALKLNEKQKKLSADVAGFDPLSLDQRIGAKIDTFCEEINSKKKDTQTSTPKNAHPCKHCKE